MYIDSEQACSVDPIAIPHHVEVRTEPGRLSSSPAMMYSAGVQLLQLVPESTCLTTHSNREECTHTTAKDCSGEMGLGGGIRLSLTCHFILDKVIFFTVYLYHISPHDSFAHFKKPTNSNK